MTKMITLASATVLVTACAIAEPIASDAVRVSDGDTVVVDGKVYRLVGYNTPETFNARCAEERALGVRADRRLRELVKGGSLELTPVPCACPPGAKDGDRNCNYGRYCAVLKVKGVDVARILTKEGLAEVYICGCASLPAAAELVRREPVGAHHARPFLHDQPEIGSAASGAARGHFVQGSISPPAVGFEVLERPQLGDGGEPAPHCAKSQMVAPRRGLEPREEFALYINT